ncbi:thioredoxin family protein [Hymenobacter ginsengisoli]|uniref:Thioredoxin family protein n=1 Tax=Hymenobacter ginsengisoli TaxID=1051626 RepID=A0ABP8Q2Q5_9BACT|nr:MULTISPECIES: thioredoxin family protein [unclassified Hymenobacter]MBO2032537.1 thioredoxin family protein [Hymenobacter sp. BT559]
MLPTTSTPVISAERLAAAYSYHAYRQLIDNLLAQGKTTGPQQSEELLAYAKLNEQRMTRLDKTVKLQPELAAAVSSLQGHYIGLIITEGWCGDAAQTVPVMEALAQASAGHLRTAYVLRDDNLDLTDQYLTNGSRSIPKLVLLRADTLTEVTHWGPRPAEAQALILRLKAEGMAHDDFIRELHAWYAHDHTQATQRELLALVQQLD